MDWVRRHLRAGTTAWLLGYAASFTALVPHDCCEAHAHRGAASHAEHAAAEAPCHETAAPAPAVGDHCPMPAHDATGAACPMHGGAAAAPAEDCRFTGVCNVPAAALSAVVMSAAVPVTAFTLSTPVLALAPPLLVEERLVSRVRPPDSPPPRRS